MADGKKDEKVEVYIAYEKNWKGNCPCGRTAGNHGWLYMERDRSGKRRADGPCHDRVAIVP